MLLIQIWWIYAQLNAVERRRSLHKMNSWWQFRFYSFDPRHTADLCFVVIFYFHLRCHYFRTGFGSRFVSACLWLMSCCLPLRRPILVCDVLHMGTARITIIISMCHKNSVTNSLHVFRVCAVFFSFVFSGLWIIMSFYITRVVVCARARHLTGTCFSRKMKTNPILFTSFLGVSCFVLLHYYTRHLWLPLVTVSRVTLPVLGRFSAHRCLFSSMQSVLHCEHIAPPMQATNIGTMAKWQFSSSDFGCEGIRNWCECEVMPPNSFGPIRRKYKKQNYYLLRRLMTITSHARHTYSVHWCFAVGSMP